MCYELVKVSSIVTLWKISFFCYQVPFPRQIYRFGLINKLQMICVQYDHAYLEQDLVLDCRYWFLAKKTDLLRLQYGFALGSKLNVK